MPANEAGVEVRKLDRNGEARNDGDELVREVRRRNRRFYRPLASFWLSFSLLRIVLTLSHLLVSHGDSFRCIPRPEFLFRVWN